MTEEEYLRAYARMWNTLDPEPFIALLPPGFKYASQWVFSEIGSADEYAAYIRGKLETIRSTGGRVYAEMATIPGGMHGTSEGIPRPTAFLFMDRTRPCVLVSQDDPEALDVLVLAEVADGSLKRMDMCFVPSPKSAVRLGEWPGVELP
jgi:hypothetical protein